MAWSTRSFLYIIQSRYGSSKKVENDQTIHWHVKRVWDVAGVPAEHIWWDRGQKCLGVRLYPTGVAVSGTRVLRREKDMKKEEIC